MSDQILVSVPPALSETDEPDTSPVDSVAVLKKRLTVLRRSMNRRNSTAQAIAKALARFNEAQAARREEVAKLEAELFSLGESISPYAREHQKELTGPDVKSVTLPSATLAWRVMPRSIVFDEDAEERLIKRLKRLGLKRFVKKREQIDEAAMLKELELVSGYVTGGKLPGLTISPAGQEFFIITPTDSTAFLRERPDGTWTVETPKSRSRKLPE